MGGLGIGLSLARHLVELHGGSISVKSTGQGQGSTFTVQLPLMAVQAHTDEINRMRSWDGGAMTVNRSRIALEGVRVLVVDDEKDAARSDQAGAGGVQGRGDNRRVCRRSNADPGDAAA